MESKQKSSLQQNNQKKIALQFIIILGIVSLFGDITYEGARSIIGPYLAILGASASIVGLIAGFAEFIGYVLRLASGYVADRTRLYWPLTFIGYGLILSIPLLAFANYWQLAALLIIVERMGKAIRSPARDSILSHATKQVGRGFGFGLHEALDQVGAIIGPLTIWFIFLLKGSYYWGFIILGIPALLTLVPLIAARKKVPFPESLEISERKNRANTKTRLPKAFWFYVLFIFFGVAGFANFQLISYHLKVESVVSDAQIPIFYAIAMGLDALIALLIGKIYDKIGLISVIAIPLLTIPIPFFAFSYNYILVAIAIMLWGATMGIHETIMRAAIADLTPIERRGYAYGIFNTIYGASWFFGSVIMGRLYDFSINYLILFIVVMELISLVVLFLFKRWSII
jgi:MFS family permease